MTRCSKAAVVLLVDEQARPEHERHVHRKLAQRIAQLMGIRFLEIDEAAMLDPRALYYLPARTLIGVDRQRELGIDTPDDFFGGLVSQPYMATKAISHELLDGAKAPPGWAADFARLARDALLRGFTVFSVDDASRAGRRLLEDGPLRIKPVRATAGRGQRVVSSPAQLAEALANLDSKELAVWGLVLEQNLSSVTTYSVGQVTVAGLTASYFGTQQLTHDHTGEEVYGGSQLTVVRGGYQQLLAIDMDPVVRTAIDLAQRYEAAAFQAFSGFVASRRNYDVVHGRDAQGQWRTGVLEQSWRVGGASSAEVLALQAFAEDPSLHQVYASTHEVFDNQPIPDDAVLFYQSDDREVGQISKYARIHDNGYSK